MVNMASNQQQLSDDVLQRISAKAKEVVEEKFSASEHFEFARTRLGLFPRFGLNELELGKVLGRGQFGVVSEIREVRLSQSDSPEEYASSNGENVNKSFKEAQEDRNFIADHCIRDGGDARYAVKLLNEEHFTDKSDFYMGVRDMAIEAHFLAAIEHPHIIKLRGLSVEDFGGKRFFLLFDRLYDTLERKLVTWATVQKKASGGIAKLKDRSGEKKREFLRERLQVAFDMSSAIMFLHANNIIDRDLKPENIGFDVRGDVKLFDFGLSAEMPSTPKPYKLTGKTGSMVYMAPEVWFEEPYDESVDVYSFGIMLWEIISLEKLYPKFNARMLEDYIMKKGVRPKVDEKWSPSLKSIITKCWAKNPSNRLAARQVNIMLRKELSVAGGDEDDMQANLVRRRSTFVQRRFVSRRNLKKKK